MTRRPRAAARQPREAILDAARHAFADKGYDHASIRAIATSAGVDPALISHYFGTGDQLHRSAMNVPSTRPR